MPSPLDALVSSTLNAQNPFGVVAARRKKEQALRDMQRSLELQAGDPAHTFSGATRADVANEQDDLNDDTNFGTDAQKRVSDVMDTDAAMLEYNRPDITARRKEDYAQKLAMQSAPAVEAAKGNVAVEHAKTEGVLREKSAQTEATQKLLEAIGGGGSSAASSGKGGLVGPGGSIKPTINASGGVSFTTTQMPALVQRARNQLMDARDKTLTALDAAEKQYPGVNTTADQTDAGATSPGWGAWLMGNAGKYGGATDQLGARNERLKYDFGLPTPFSELAQTASFGNIEQMAGQLPGVRGLATITPLFKEHQSRWGHETPLATVQRLRHMAKLMDETLHTLDTSGAGEPEQP